MEELKKMAAKEAVRKVRDGMVVGLGTGSTAKYAILEIGKMVREGMEIIGIATSVESEKLAMKEGIKIGDINEYDVIDITIDGADQVDTDLNLIKGGGGALLREKVVASCSRKEIIVVDESKMVENFSFPLPVEVVRFGWKRTADKLRHLNLKPHIRHGFITDNGNYILDCHYEKIVDCKELHDKINNIPGVVENGLFIKMADEVIIGMKDEIKIMERL